MKPKSIISIFCWMLLWGGNSFGQTVTVFDANFLSFLQQNFPGCVSGNQLNTQCPAVFNCQTLNISSKNISNLGGIAGFTNLHTLNCANNNISSIITLPQYLVHLDASLNPITNIFPLPTTITDLRLGSCGLTTLPALPPNLNTLEVGYNPIGNLPTLPNTMISLGFANTNATVYPNISPTLTYLDASYNNLGPLPPLPSGLWSLGCSGMQLTSLPTLPSGLIALYCGNNSLTSLPTLPATLSNLNAAYNQIATVPALPSGLDVLDLRGNQLTSVPTLPAGLASANFSNNQITCFEPFPQPSSLNLIATGNPFNCIPNYPAVMDPLIGTIPLCVTGNSNGCPFAEGIGGKIYTDGNTDCHFTTGEAAVTNAPLKLYDNSGAFVQAAMSYSLGDYFFSQAAGTWKAEIDTVAKPYRVTCTYPGIDSTVVLSPSTPLAMGVDFAVECKPGFDVGAASVVHNEPVRPGRPFTALIEAGDLSQAYGLHCAAGVAGQIEVTVTGPVTYTSTPIWALTPTISGNTYTYAIADFGSLNIYQNLQLTFTTDTTAVAGDSVCFQINVTPTSGDWVPGNNSLNLCFYVVNSFDPNYKEVYPQRVFPAYAGWIDYTIHFQNTGNADAYDIRLEDTLDNNLDFETMQFVHASHPQSWTLVGNHLTVNYPNIMLPDSATDPVGSQGYFQFRMKPKPGLAGGVAIRNRASIYFDYNAPVVTNTALTAFTIGVGVDDVVNENPVHVFPNPSTGRFQVEYPANWKHAEWTVSNLMGQTLRHDSATGGAFAVDLSTQPAGFYLLKLSDGKQEFVRHLVKD
jgi:uncharacterized repeat protein (TIGR01451 family)